jgi:hypothetical protein
MNPSVALALITFLTLLANIWYSIYKAKRDRKWALEDRARLDRVSRQIDENTQISVDAFNQANHVNEKIATVTENHVASNEELLSAVNALRAELAAKEAAELKPTV